MPTQYLEVFKKSIIHRYENGESIKDLSRELHISQSTLYRWRKEYRTIQAPGHSYTPAEFDALSRRLQKAEHELEVIRLSNYITEVPRRKRLSTLEELYHHPDNSYSVHELCDALRAILKINNNQRGETRQDNHVGRHSERQIE